MTRWFQHANSKDVSRRLWPSGFQQTPVEAMKVADVFSGILPLNYEDQAWLRRLRASRLQWHRTPALSSVRFQHGGGSGSFVSIPRPRDDEPSRRSRCPPGS